MALEGSEDIINTKIGELKRRFHRIKMKTGAALRQTQTSVMYPLRQGEEQTEPSADRVPSAVEHSVASLCS